MVAVPAPRTWAKRDIGTYDVVASEVYQAVSFLLNPPVVKLRQALAAGVNPVASSDFTGVQWNIEDTDPYQFHSVSTNPTRIVPNVPGWYRGWFTVGFTDGTGTGNYRTAELVKNGTANRVRRDTRPAVTAGQSRVVRAVPFIVNCNGTTDYLEVYAFQDSGATQSLQNLNATGPEFFMRWWAAL